jgi:hypothetical protein
MTGAIPLLPLYAFMVQIETASPSWMEHSYSWEANGHSFSQEILHAFKLKVYCCLHKSLPLYPFTGFEAKKKIVT